MIAITTSSSMSVNPRRDGELEHTCIGGRASKRRTREGLSRQAEPRGSVVFLAAGTVRGLDRLQIKRGDFRGVRLDGRGEVRPVLVEVLLGNGGRLTLGQGSATYEPHLVVAFADPTAQHRGRQLEGPVGLDLTRRRARSAAVGDELNLQPRQ